MSLPEILSAIDAEISRLEQARTLLAPDGAVTRRGKSAVKSPRKSKRAPEAHHERRSLRTDSSSAAETLGSTEEGSEVASFNGNLGRYRPYVSEDLFLPEIDAAHLMAQKIAARNVWLRRSATALGLAGLGREAFEGVRYLLG